MTNIDDGVIKFTVNNKEMPLKLDIKVINSLENWRKKLYAAELIGEYKSEHIGYGNLSLLVERFGRNDQPEFLISGTQTGNLPHLSEKEYTLVYSYDLVKNIVNSEGPMKPSSESLTHAAIYLGNQEINAVFHGHDTHLWNEMINHNYLSTATSIPYGTIEMAIAVQQLTYDKPSGLFVMKGHQDGIVSWGRSADEAGDLLLEVYHKFKR